MFLSFTSDTLIFADADKVAGGIINQATDQRSVIVTSALLAAIEAAILQEAPLPPAILDLINSSQTMHVDPAGGVAPAALDILPGFTLSEQKPAFGGIKTESFAEDGTTELSGQQVWRPAGAVTERTVNYRRVLFVVSPKSLVGTVKRQDGLAAVKAALTPQIVVEVRRCGSCVTCGVCGLCSLCAEINAASAASAAIAVTAAVQVLSAQEAFAATPSPGSRRLNADQQSLIDKLNLLIPE